MKLEIACKSPFNCSFSCLNCRYSLGFDDFKNLYNKITIEFNEIKNNDNNRIE